ncbi:hypothetical protein CAEBREN_14774 [Caenorhabditis brenneri]|uniref:Uncharacterized protein n=1 Tax=Caenorhabditis brenneri TaxID=135651 RepID=G0MBE0_CAEBE|nr:hypothetical protein CAEBREN_14774 [Caenorhabditis brenneri]
MAQSGSSSRMQSAPITIAYDNQETRRFWRDSYRWSNQVDSDEEEEYEQNHHSDADEEQVMTHYDGFSGGDVAEAEPENRPVGSAEQEEEKQDVVVAAVEPVQQAEPVQWVEDVIEAPQKSSADAAYDMFEQLLAENEAKLRNLISRYTQSQLAL